MASTAPQAALHNVFVYGSLLADDVVHILLNRVPQYSPAILHGYHRFSIKGRVYPAILPLENKKVTGRVLLGITPPELFILDTFEDVEYERKAVEVQLMDSSEKLLAETYVWSNMTDPNLYGDWNFEEWERLHKEEFMKMSTGFMEELEMPESKTRVATYEEFFQQKD
ncbi:hypothetical protein M9H77_13404 [Catharanthus roseus]|uniref:Uncharacterized protein n=1 Tax=Catharanthus roseus TaxID=4058 RepID=A0ACC0BJZ7_CATRO|nr:hypothetical protein M9H77_13404 [Catharanthus roseus]